MTLEIVAYGIARDILQHKTMHLDVPEGTSIAGLKQVLFDRYPALQGLASVSFAVDEEYQDDAYPLSDRQSVVIIPPVSGG
jgi:molybdopterin converting factor small subunit